ncbi:MAG TPA: DUF1349 domain-containing protein, partial [Gaiellaceae bacterium]
EPVGAHADDGVLEIAAGRRTDWFVDPGGIAPPVASAPALVGTPSGDFQLSAHVAVAFGAMFDAGALVLFGHERAWAKLCLEYSPRSEPMIVSVVTRDLSDDCNSFVVDGNDAWLRVSRIGRQFAFHASTDGSAWELIRHFALHPDEEMLVGFEAQSPRGEGCTAHFTGIRYEQTTLADIRSGR